jgi:[acyl-carrier-protein] S-malonyltransferase
MGKIAFIFAGQGSQYVGMGKELYDSIPASKKVFDEAEKALGIDMASLCFEGPKEELDKTENTQPAILTVSIAALKALEEKGIKADVTAGFSLGEYSALIYSGALDFSDGVKLVKKRGKYMQEAVPEGVGTMAAILGLAKEKVLDVCRRAGEIGVVEAVNFNCPGQIVVAGEIPAVERAMALAKEEGALKTIQLSVSAPFHSSMLEPASIKLEEELRNVELKDIKVPILTNVNADYIGDKSEIKNLLKKQAMSPVLWEDIILKMIESGVDTFIEIGPGKTLSGFVKKINRKIAVLNVEDIKSLNKIVEILGL